ncbi:MAG: excinuclease ABC subunit C, partial [Bacillus sp. (in: firmicutes)]
HKTIKTNILTTFKTKEDASITKISRDEIDAAQIIYSYLKRSNCSYIPISEALLETVNTAHLEEAIHGLMET